MPTTPSKKTPPKKGSTPTKKQPKKLSFNLESTPIKKKKAWGNVVDVFQTEVWQYVIGICFRGDKAEGPYVNPMVEEFENDITEAVAKEWKLYGIFPRRGPVIDGEDTELPKSPTSQYRWEAFLLKKDSEDDTPRSLGENLAAKFTSFVKASPKFDKDIPFRFRNEYSDDPKPVAYFLKDCDTALLLKRSFCGKTKEELLADDDVMEAFYGSPERGADALAGISDATWATF